MLRDDVENSKIFNRVLLRKRRNRIAVHWKNYNFLKKAASERIADCLLDIARDFPLALDLGCHAKEVAGLLSPKSNVISCDLAQNMQPDIVCDEELLPFRDNIFDLVISSMALHHINDIVGTLIQIKHLLKPDGFFIAILPGANSLLELRNSVLAVSAEHNFPLSPRVSPFVEVRDAGSLLQRGGFALSVVNSEIITVHYESAFRLMQDLKGQGESNILCQQSQNFTSGSHLAAICHYYEKNFRDKEGLIPATFELITMSGWKPHASQQMPAKRGSAEVSLQTILH